MKKIELSALVALALAACACNKEIEQPGTDGPEVPIGPGAIVFTAGVPTKTAIDANDEVVTWVAGDEVKFVWNGGSATAEASASGASTTFTIDSVGDDVEEIYAVYPASASGGYNEGKVNVTFNGSKSDGSFAANDICVARAVKTEGAWDTNLSFKIVSCMVKVGVESGSELTKLEVASLDGEILSGTLPVSIDGSGNPTFGTPEGNTSNKVGMSVSGPGNYYIPVMPDVSLARGFRVNRHKGGTQLIPFYYYGSFTTGRGQLIKLSDIDSHAGQYYVTPDGAGTLSGQSWSNAMSAAKFKTFVETSGNNFLLNGATFHFSAEEFTFGDYVQPKFNSSVSFTLEGTISGENKTTFIGANGTTAGSLWPKANASVTVRNILFTQTNGDSTYGAVLIKDSSAALTLENCEFNGNQTSGNGGAVCVSAGAVAINDCNFIGNHSTAGACIYINPSEDVTVNVNGGTFEGNYAKGGAVLFGAYATGVGTSTANFTGITFKDNYSSITDANDYGIFRLADYAKVTFDQCTFDGNYINTSSSSDPNYFSSIIRTRSGHVTCYFNACEFKQNRSGLSSRGGKNGILMNANASSVSFAFNNCSLHDNYSTRNAEPLSWILITGSSTKLIIANSTLSGNPQRKVGSGDPLDPNSNGTPIKTAFIRIEKTGNYHLINSLIAARTMYSINASTAITVANSYYSKTSPGYGSAITYTSDTGSGHDYYSTDTYFGSWSAPYTWNGTLLQGTNHDQLAATADVNTQIQNADANFYSWLSGIGALGKDINGRDRGATSWPGCYQN